jgi:hypothetical protein
MKRQGITVVKESELSKVHNNLLNADQLGFLMQKTNSDNTYTRPAKGGGEWTYVTGSYVKKVLNLMFGWDWDFEIIEHKFDLQIKQAYVLGKLTVRTGGKEIKKMQFGRVEIKFKNEWKNGVRTVSNIPLDIGNDLKAASTDCLKKCASELGIASDIYAPNEFKEIRVAENNEENPSPIEELMGLLESKRGLLSNIDAMRIEHIIETKLETSYFKTIQKLKTL